MRKSLRSSSSRTGSYLSQLFTFIALLVLATPSLTQAAEGEEQARAHFRLGRAYYENGDFGKAATEFESAFRISQRPGLLYNIYLAYRDASDVPHAAEALRKYLELEKEVENRGQLTARLAAMDRALAEEAAQSAAAAEAPAAAPSQSSPSTLTPAQAAAPSWGSQLVSAARRPRSHSPVAGCADGGGRRVGGELGHHRSPGFGQAQRSFLCARRVHEPRKLQFFARRPLEAARRHPQEWHDIGDHDRCVAVRGNRRGGGRSCMVRAHAES
jgi:tetratricopeptide (TPR) repeat protein